MYEEDNYAVPVMKINSVVTRKPVECAFGYRLKDNKTFDKYLQNLIYTYK